MNKKEWAKNEVLIACTKEKEAAGDSNDWEYGCACYQSALDAYKSLLDDGHSGFSWSITRNILIRLMNDLPLTPIEDIPEIWKEVPWRRDDGAIEYQCERMGSLFKTVYSDGQISYHDTRRVVCAKYNDKNGMTWQCGHIHSLVDHVYPITMPYIPSDNPIVVYVKEFTFSKLYEEVDTVGVIYADLPDGNVLKINRYFKYENDDSDDWTEIDHNEFRERAKIAKANNEVTE